MSKTVGADGTANRGNRHGAKLTLEQVEDIREEWSRKQELERLAREYLDEAVELSSRAAKLEKESKEAMSEAMKITQRGLAKDYGVAVATMQSIVNGDSWA